MGGKAQHFTLCPVRSRRPLKRRRRYDRVGESVGALRRGGPIASRLEGERFE
jgi:hypothetical protein